MKTVWMVQEEEREKVVIAIFDNKEAAERCQEKLGELKIWVDIHPMVLYSNEGVIVEIFEGVEEL